MSQQEVKDYLGHPCRFSEAKERFSEPYSEAQAREFRDIRRSVGMFLLELSNRLSHSLNASNEISSLLDSCADAEGPHSLLEMMAAYDLKSANMFFNFAGLVLAGFDHVESEQVQTVASTAIQGRA